MQSNEKNNFQKPLKNIFQKHQTKIIKLEKNKPNSWIWKKERISSISKRI